jgi:alkylresorcinol/alkylpyrone synthase
MYLHAIASAFPEQAYTQTQCLEYLQSLPQTQALQPRSQALLRKVLSSDSGIDKRHIAIDPIDRVFALDAQGQNRAFEYLAPQLAKQALTKALCQANLVPGQIDALLVCTCTGYLCPGLSSHIAEQLGLPAGSILQDIVGLGCGAAIPTLRQASQVAAANPQAVVATIAVEVCTAAFYMNDDPGVLISLCLFGDGAAAALWTGESPGRGAWRADHFQSLHWPEHREKVRFVNANGHLCNQLDRNVPTISAEAVHQLYQSRSSSSHPAPRVITHTGGRDVLEAIRNKLPEAELNESTAVLSQFGNLSSPSVLIALEHFLNAPVGDAAWLSAFGAGFSCHACEVRRHL